MRNPLVSICVVSYNSTNTILETLDSIYKQTYNDIELIVSDDCSKDASLQMTRDWIDNHQKRFINVNLIESKVNTGVTLNVNRGLKVANGSFLKIIAADDVLLPSYISDCVSYMEEHNEIQALFTKVIFFNKENKNLPDESIIDYNFFSLTAEQQFKQIILNGVPCIPTPSVIYRSTVIKSLHYFDERIPMWEDGPMYFTLAKNGIKTYLLDKKDLLNRVRTDSLSHEAPLSHRQSEALFYKIDIFPYERKLRPFKSLFHLFKSSLLYHSDIAINRILLSMLTKK